MLRIVPLALRTRVALSLRIHRCAMASDSPITSCSAVANWARLLRRVDRFREMVSKQVVMNLLAGRTQAVKDRKKGMEAIAEEQASCGHPVSRMTAHGNGHGHWTKCGMCSIRLSYRKTGEPLTTWEQEMQDATNFVRSGVKSKAKARMASQNVSKRAQLPECNETDWHELEQGARATVSSMMGPLGESKASSSIRPAPVCKSEMRTAMEEMRKIQAEQHNMMMEIAAALRQIAGRDMQS